jgi:hypothetical protein
MCAHRPLRRLQPLQQPAQGPVLGLLGVLGLAQGAAEAAVARQRPDLNHPPAGLGMDEARLNVHQFGHGSPGSDS